MQIFFLEGALTFRLVRSIIIAFLCDDRCYVNKQTGTILRKRDAWKQLGKSKI